jgi:hypothetical protein
VASPAGSLIGRDAVASHTEMPGGEQLKGARDGCRVPLAGGRPRLLYRGVTGPQAVVSLNSDASGQHLLLTWRLNSWIDHRRLRPLAPRSRVGRVRALADAW